MQIYFKTMRIAKKLYFFYVSFVFYKEEFVGCFMHFIYCCPVNLFHI